MARREQREFSEGENLRVSGQGDFGVEERKPLWAQEMENSEHADDLMREAVREADAEKREKADREGTEGRKRRGRRQTCSWNSGE